MSIVEKLKGSKDILLIQEVDTPFGSGYKAVVAVGNAKKTCHLIQDKETGEWKSFGDENACYILSRNLAELGSPLTGATSTEKIKSSTPQAQG